MISTARQVGAQSATALEVVEAVINAAEDEGALVRETSALILAALGEYNCRNGVTVLVAELEQIQNSIDQEG